MISSAEKARLISLEAHQILDTAPEQEFDSIVRLASHLAGTPIALVSLVDECRQWFKARQGLDVAETPRDVAFCAVSIETPGAPTVIPDATVDPRFRANPLVVDEPHIRFYAGFPVCDGEGRPLGTLCVIDRVPRELDGEQLSALEHLAGLVEQLLRSRITLGALDAARRRSALFEAGFDSTQVGMQLLRPDGTFIRVNRAFAEMVGRPPEELAGLNWRDLTHDDDRHVDRRIREELKAGRRGQYQQLKRYVRPDGTIVWGDMSVTAVFPDGVDRPDSVVHLTQVIDVTARVEASERERAATRRLEASERRYRSLVEPAPDAVIRCTASGVVSDANRVAGSMLGVEDLAGRHLDELLPSRLAEQLAGLLERVARTGRAEAMWRQWLEPADREPGWYVLRIVPEVDDDSPEPHVYVVASDTTELVESERRLSELAMTDAVTGCASRVAVLERLRDAVDGVEGRQGGVAVAVVDLDGFKSINDTHGHAVGDRALSATAAAIGTVVRAGDTTGRLGGDEFVVVFEQVEDADRADRLACRIRDAVDEVSVRTADGIEVSVRSSVGVAWTDAATPVDDLLALADARMYESKRASRGRPPRGAAAGVAATHDLV